MKVVFKKSDLVNVVNIVLKAIPSKTTMTILQCILIDATTDYIKFTGNDMELGIETIVDGEIIEKGIIAIDAKMFSDIVKKLPDNEVVIDTNSDYTMNIVCENARFKISGKSGEDFSRLPIIEKDKMIYMSQFTLKEAVRQTIFSIADNDNNKIMTGELFEVNGDTLKLTSLDGHRISIRKITLKESFEDISVIIPGKTLSEICKILPGGNDDEVRIFFSTNHVVFEFDKTIVVSRLIEGEYFMVSKMLSSDYETKIIINRKEFIECIDRSTLMVRENDNKPIVFNIQDGELELKISSMIGSMNESIPITKEGKDLLIGFNPKLLLDALRAIDEEEINIYMINSKAPCFIKDDNETYTYLILPINFNAASV